MVAVKVQVETNSCSPPPPPNDLDALNLNEDRDLRSKPHQASEQSQTEDQVQADDEQGQLIIPGLPRSLAYKCLARVPRESHPLLIQVSKAWRKALLSGDIYRLRKALGIQEPWIYLTFCPNAKVLCKQQQPQLSSALSSGTWLEAYDPRLNLWHNLGPLPGLPESRTLKGFAFVALDDKVYVVGGRLICTGLHHDRPNNSHAADQSNSSNKINVVSSSEMEMEVIRKEMLVFNCSTREWRQCASMSTPRVNFACTVCKGRIYVAGGRSLPGQEKGVSSAEVYMPEADCWVPLPGMSTGRYKCVGVTCNERIHIVGGFAGPEDSEMIHPFTIDRSCVDVFHPSSGQWAVLKGMWQLDVPPNQIVSVEGRLYSSGDALNTWKGRIEEYDTALNMWKIVEGSWLPMTHPEECQNSERCYLTMAPMGHCLYFLGGYRLLSDDIYTSLHTIYIFDTTAQDAASQWQLVEPVQDTCKELCSHCCVVAL